MIYERMINEMLKALGREQSKHYHGGTMDFLDPVISETELADYLKVSVWKLRKDRELDRGIPYQKIGNLVRYPITAIKEYQAENTVNFSPKEF